MGKKRKVFTKEFKEDAVNHWQDSGKTADAFPGNGFASRQRPSSVKSLKTRSRSVIFKKALCIFSKL